MPVDLAKRIAEGVTAKLNFDYACNRGHSFGEIYVHGVVNEILSANIGTHVARVHSGFAHPSIQANPRAGRPREIDFAVENLPAGTSTLYAEVKWAGSSHCTDQRILLDLCRLQLVKAAEAGADCLFVLAGEDREIQSLFSKGMLTINTSNLLLAPSVEGLNLQHNRRTREFDLNNNMQYATQIQTFRADLGTKLPMLPGKIVSSIVNFQRFNQTGLRFNTIVWRVETV